MSHFFAEGPNKLVNCFRKSDKQLAYLHNIMTIVYGKPRALIATVPTRWGTQYRQLESIAKSEEALKAYALHPNATPKLKGLILQEGFWSSITTLQAFLRPLHEYQKMSESNASTLNKVYLQ